MEKFTQYQKVQKLIEKMSDKSTFDTREIMNLYEYNFGDIKESSISWIIYKLVKDNIIIRHSRNKYIKTTANDRRQFRYECSQQCEELVGKIFSDYKDIKMQIWELKILNEFLNHQLAVNVIFVEVERGFEDFIFESIKDKKLGTVLMKPDLRTFNQVMSDNIIIVLNLISETKGNKDDIQKITIEKLIVDLFSNKYLLEIISRSELSQIIDTIVSRYFVDRATLYRYARRRSKKNIIEQFIKIGENDFNDFKE